MQPIIAPRAILEFEDGRYAAAEIKLGANSIPEAIRNLENFYSNVVRKPEFMCVIVGTVEAAYRDPESGVFVVPITSLGVY